MLEGRLKISVQGDPTPEEFMCLRAEGLTIQAIAEHWHFATRDSVYVRVKKWRAEGRLQPYCAYTLNDNRVRARNGRIVSSTDDVSQKLKEAR